MTTATDARPTIPALFRVRPARLFFVGVALSLFGDNVLVLAAGVWVKTLTGNDGASGLVAFFVVLPTLFSPLFGVLADRVRKRRLMIGTNLLMAAVTPLLLLVHDARQIFLIYVVMLAYGIATVTLSSAQSGLFVVMVPERLLGTANSVFTSMQEGMKVLAPPVGAALFVWLGGGLVGLLDAVTFLVACAALARLRVDEPAPRPSRRRLRAEVTEGFRHIAALPALRRLVTAAALIMFTTGLVTTALYGVVEDGLRRPPAFLGVVVAMQGIGSVVGGLLAPRLTASRGETRLVGLGAGLVAVGTAVLLVPAAAVVLPGNVLRGVGLSWMLVGAITLLQRRTAGHLMGRAASALYMLLFVPSAAALLASAGLSQLVDHRVLVVVAAGLAATAGVLLLGRSAGTAGPGPETGSVPDSVRPSEPESV